MRLSLAQRVAPLFLTHAVGKSRHPKLPGIGSNKRLGIGHKELAVGMLQRTKSFPGHIDQEPMFEDSSRTPSIKHCTNQVSHCLQDELGVIQDFKCLDMQLHVVAGSQKLSELAQGQPTGSNRSPVGDPGRLGQCRQRLWSIR